MLRSTLSLSCLLEIMYSGYGPFSGIRPTCPIVPQHVKTRSPLRTCCGRYSCALAFDTNTNPSGTKCVRSSLRFRPRTTGTPSSTKYLELIFEPNGPATHELGSGDLISP